MIKKYDPIIQAIFASLFTWGMFIIHYHLFTHYIYRKGWILFMLFLRVLVQKFTIWLLRMWERSEAS